MSDAHQTAFQEALRALRFVRTHPEKCAYREPLGVIFAHRSRWREQGRARRVPRIKASPRVSA